MPSPVHLFVLVHGLWGDISHLQMMEDVLLSSFSSKSTEKPCLSSSTVRVNGNGNGHAAASTSTASQPADVDVRVLRVQGNENDKTYDGIDINASRVVEELDAEIERLEAEGREIAYLSVAGYSLGGLVARYALGILYTRKGFFNRHRPMNFATFASPWIGSLKYNTLFNKLFTAIGSRFVSRTGEQLFCVDKEQLVSRLARKEDVFYKALQLFSRIDVFASAQADRTVPFPSGAFVEIDPFEDWETSGLEVELYDNSPIVKSYHRPSPPTSSSSSLVEAKDASKTSPSPPAMPKLKPKRKHLLPPFLRFRFPLNILFFLFLPLLIPLALSLLLIRFGRESRRSRRRLRRTDSEGLWARIRELEKVLESELEDGLGLVGSTNGGPPAEAVKSEKLVSGLRLTDSQRGMIRSLDELPNLKKWFAWFPEAFNSHAMIIGRDPKKFPDHGKGRLVIKFWADRVLLDRAKQDLVQV